MFLTKVISRYKFKKNSPLKLDDDRFYNEAKFDNQTSINDLEIKKRNSRIKNFVSKKQADYCLYWKNVAQDYTKKLDDSAREKDIHKEQAIGFNKN